MKVRRTREYEDSAAALPWDYDEPARSIPWRLSRMSREEVLEFTDEAAEGIRVRAEWGGKVRAFLRLEGDEVVLLHIVCEDG